jgi:hypothetical protein
MRDRFRILFIATLGLVLLPFALAADGISPAVEGFVLNPPASAAPAGQWAFAPSCGYLWMPVMADAEWAPWDPWWAMPYGRWAWAEGLGWGWCPVPPWDMSPLGWGYDSWYGGWYGVCGLGSYGPTPDDYYSSTLFYLRALRGTGPDEPPKPKVAPAVLMAVVASPPTALAAIRPMREPKDPGDTGIGGGQRPGPSHDGQGARRTKGHGSRVRTWDDIIAARMARGLHGPPVASAQPGDGGPSGGPTRGFQGTPAAAPSASSGTAKQR